MDDSDPYRGTNPWSLARYLRNSCTRCPVCRKECGFEVSFDREEEVIRMSSDCPTCGRTLLVPYVTEDGDITVETVDGTLGYLPDKIVRKLRDRPVIIGIGICKHVELILHCLFGNFI